MIVNVINRPEMKLEHLEDLSFFYECRTFLHKEILSGYVRVLDLSSFLPPLLNNVGLKGDPAYTAVIGSLVFFQPSMSTTPDLFESLKKKILLKFTFVSTDFSF